MFGALSVECSPLILSLNQRVVQLGPLSLLLRNLTIMLLFT